MSAPTSLHHEKLIQCDVSELRNAPPYESEDWIALRGASASQVSFAASVRKRKMTEWLTDLPTQIGKALGGIDDSTWWLANQNEDSASIRWPGSWKTGKAEVVSGSPPVQAPSRSREEKRRELFEGYGGSAVPPSEKAQNVEEFEAFARKVCRSPELAYLTIMALFHRQTKDPRAQGKFTEARQAVNKHLAAIDQIFGNP